ncbi:MAG: DUF4065 domain-containing protein [Deltaproteobacteria bacterium]|jgi:hypothetical protein|nr:DUF4065 domain-containing protein [Deltaproteobacteria bacterium]
MDAFIRLANAMHFVIEFARLNKFRLNATLLLKIIFFSEVRALYDGCEPLTKVRMIKAQYGPAPEHYQDALNWLVIEKKIQILTGKDETSFKDISSPDVALFNDQQLDILRSVTHIICTEFTASIISDWTHKNRIWDLLDINEKIPLSAYLPNSKIFMEFTPEELEKYRLKAESYEVPEEFQISSDL